MSATARSNFTSVGLYLDGIGESASGVRPAAGVNHISCAYVFFIGDVSVGVENSAIVFEESFGDLFAAGHLEVEDDATTPHGRRPVRGDSVLHRRAVLPEISFMVLAFLVRRLHALSISPGNRES
jgi:hypothetical protein